MLGLAMLGLAELYPAGLGLSDISWARLRYVGFAWDVFDSVGLAR